MIRSLRSLYLIMAVSSDDLLRPQLASRTSSALHSASQPAHVPKQTPASPIERRRVPLQLRSRRTLNSIASYVRLSLRSRSRSDVQPQPDSREALTIRRTRRTLTLGVPHSRLTLSGSARLSLSLRSASARVPS
ncbi:hypothetical protein F2Q70_00020196 [Brassica cretica]|uniref:Uncharacterized protein n=1 Tax=Brassica cretica TaxID=69181 RepID=A0A8S9GQK2_BRACR|nr:hypothetical protein F2Q70_00020196 [Brassica cretica]